MESLSIVIVDDEPEIANLMRLMLLKEAPHLDIHVLDSGQACLEYLDDHLADCILSDYQMPYMNGMELLKALRERGNDIPFIFVTGQGNEEIARNAFKNGANDYFTKEIGFAHFARILNSIGQAIRQRNAEAAKRDELASRQAAEETLKESEAMFRDLAEEALAGVYLIQEGKFVYLNRKAAEIHGRSREELTGAKDIFETVHPEDREIVRENMKNRLEGHLKTADYQFRIVKRDGSVSFIEVLGSYTTYKGQPAIIGTLIDVTERTRAERALTEERDRVRKIFDTVRSIMLVIAPDETVVKINRKGCEVLGYDEEEIVGRNWFDNFIPENHRDEIRDVFRKMIAGDTAPVENYQNAVLTKSGEERVIDWRNSALKYQKSGGFFTLSSGEDITEKKKAEEALFMSEARYRAFIANSMEGIWRYELEKPVDISMPEDEQIELFYRYAYLAECNDAMARMYGFEKAGDMVGTRLGDTMPRSDPRNIHYLKDLIRSGYKLEKEETYEKDVQGNTHVFLNNYIGVVENGFLMRAWGVQKDVTGQKQAERQKEDFYAMITHDIKSSLTAILGYAELLNTMPQGSEVNEMLAAMCTSGNRLSALLENCMTISRTEAGKLAIQPSLCDIAAVLRETYAGMEKQMKEKELQFSVEIGAGLPRDFMMDHRLIVRAVSNLLQNSINYTARGGNIVLKASPATEAGRDFLVISVADTGIGIPAEELGSIFDKYYRSGRAAGVRGTGLGLAIVKAVAEAHGGRVEVESRLDQGSVFRLYIPTRPGW